MILHKKIALKSEKVSGEVTLGMREIEVDLIESEMNHLFGDSSTISNNSHSISSKKGRNISIVQPSSLGHFSLEKYFKTE